MLSLFKKKQSRGEILKFKVEGMHCTSCVMNIDDTLEDLDGVHSANSSYIKGEVVVDLDSNRIKPKDIVKAIKEAGYKASLLN